MERRLAAILAADVAGYTALMGADEAGTLERLTGLRQDFLEPLIADHHGRVVKLMGDGILVEFGSVVDAVACALVWQAGVGERDETLKFRIGINVGDVIVEGEDIHGDGINVAARLESLAEPGGICLSGDAYRQTRGKVEATFEDLGEQALKNVAEPVRVYQYLLNKPAAGQARQRTVPARRSLSLPALAGGLALLIIAASVALWQRPWEPREEPASVEAMAFPLPDKPSIAVLPFNNLSEDQSQEYFADGMTEDLITDLSKISGLFVIARNSSFSYKGQQVKIRRVAEELGVRYVLEGSVRRAGDEIRINAQLIDATTGGHIWAERYDGTLEDVFDLQDQVTEQIVEALAISLTGAEQAEQARHGTENAQAHDAYLQGWARYKLLTPEDLKDAVPFFEEALRLDPAYAQAHAALASLYWDVLQNDWAFDLGMISNRVEQLANDHLEKGLEVPTPLAHALQAKMLASWGFNADAVTEAEKAVALDGNDAPALAGLADALVKADRAAEGLDYIEQAMRLDPHHPPSYLIILGAAQFGMEDFEAAAATFERAVKRNPDNEIPFIYVASTYGHLERIDDADAAIDEANKLRNLMGLRELTLRDAATYAYNPNPSYRQIDFTQFGSKPVQDLVRAGLTAIPELKWQYLITIHRVLGPGNTWWEVEGVTTIDATTAKSLYDRGVVFINVSVETWWRAGHIPGSIHLPQPLPKDPYKKRLTKATLGKIVDKNQEVVFYGGTLEEVTLATPAACARALTWGFTQVYYFAGGVPAWNKAGYPVETGQ